ncbi:histidine kinase [Paraburkholderia sp. FT54]|uniref:sensor histidine kinase n=1 Tax=Paraburkholderia sp. FT54 TaxID=3074437 RepID=UPI002877C363|nr:histidine kinase [Paraburkholderia sp. FT54]WNC94594.1 histidine kinase [Paraburkholderia sp. FT54]
MRKIFSRRAHWLVTAMVLFASLAAMEWWSSYLAGADVGLRGVVTGMALMGAIFLLLNVFNDVRKPWVASLYATLIAAVEMGIGAAVIATVAGLAIYALPFSISERLFQGDAVSDFIILVVVGLSLLVAARNLRHYARQKTRAMEANLEAARAREATAQKEKALALSQIMTLRAQIEPHFLWNTLAHLQFLIQKAPADAGLMLTHLIRYLRAAIPHMRNDTATLGSEFESVGAYLELMKVRMGDRLTVSVDLPDALRGVPFAPLLVQTLVENAIKHGVEPKLGAVSVSVAAEMSADNGGGVLIEVRDNGIGLQSAPATRGTGLGLRSVRERMQQLYGPNAVLSIAGAPGGGVIARMMIPGIQSRLT